MSNNITKESLILRDELALDRTVLANQRTLLTYVRMGIFLFSTAFGFYYLEKKEAFGMVEWVLVALGVGSIISGLIVYRTIRNRILKLYQ